MQRLDRRELLQATAGALVAGGALGRLGAAAAAGPDPRLAELARLVSGPVVVPGSGGYGTARLVYNERFDGVRPLAIVRVQDVKDVQAVVRWAQRTGVPIVPRSGGHSYGGWSTGTGVVVDLGTFRGIRVEGGTAVVGAGRRLIDVYSALAGKGLTVPAGSCASVALGGLALGGGIGLASRKLGTTSDNIESLRIVTADGRLLTCNAKHNADLFWACRGGGGRNFGIVTDFRLRAAPVSTGAYFFATWPWSAGPTIVPAWQRWAPNAPDDLMTLCRLSTGASGPTLEIFGQYLGPEKHLPGLLAPLTKAVPPTRSSSGTSSYLDLMLRWAGCLGRSSAACHLVTQGGTLGRAAFAGKSDYVRKPFPAAVVRTLQRGLETRQSAGHGSGSVIMDAYGGAIARVAPGATAFVHRAPLHSIQYLAYWGAPIHQQPSLAWLRSFHDSMRPYVTGGAYVNYADPDLVDWQSAYYGSNYARLVSVKRRYDPDRLFRFPQAIG
ncbi:MAG: FAD-binding oxidoreductase [Verrucomicrobiota bacterium]